MARSITRLAAGRVRLSESKGPRFLESAPLNRDRLWTTDPSGLSPQDADFFVINKPQDGFKRFHILIQIKHRPFTRSRLASPKDLPFDGIGDPVILLLKSLLRQEQLNATRENDLPAVSF